MSLLCGGFPTWGSPAPPPAASMGMLVVPKCSGGHGGSGKGEAGRWAMGEHPAPEQTRGRRGSPAGCCPSPVHPPAAPCGPQGAAGVPLLCLQGAGGTRVLLVWGGPRAVRGRGSRSQAKILVLCERAGGDASPPAEPCAFGCGEGR